MKLKPSVKYHLYGIKPTIIIFYIVVAILSIASMIISFILKDSDSTFGGIAASSMIFLFVIGICSFYEVFKMFSQNGLTRHELWKSFLIASVIVSVIMSTIDLLLLLVLSLIINAKSLVMMLSSVYLSNSILQIINTYFLQILFYTLVLSIGYFVRLIYYRMNKIGVISLSVGVPVFLFIVLPILSAYYNLEPIFEAFFSFLGSIMNPDKFYGLTMVYVFFLVLLAITAFINKLLIKKAVVK